MTYSYTQTDMIAMISIILKKIPYCYSEDSAEWLIEKDEVVSIDFKEKEIQLINWNCVDDIIYLQILGMGKMFNLEIEEYKRK